MNWTVAGERKHNERRAGDEIQLAPEKELVKRPIAKPAIPELTRSGVVDGQNVNAP